jgi:hypothetical protein
MTNASFLYVGNIEGMKTRKILKTNRDVAQKLIGR